MEQKRIVIKVGSLAVTEKIGGVSLEKIKCLVEELVYFKNLSYQIILVSSGAINSAKGLLPIPEEKKDRISYQQALAAVGQPMLMSAYQQVLSSFDWKAAQILVTHEDFKERKRFLNIRNTINQLLAAGILPIINENDSVSFDEITVGDNDQLAVMVTEACDAQSLVILSEADGLYDRDPKDPKAQKIQTVDYRDDFKQIKIAAKTAAGRGGMSTKLQAVRKLTPLGVQVISGSFEKKQPLKRLILESQGTVFEGNPQKISSQRMAWLVTLVKNDCVLMVDEGAAKALLEKESSLLPVGIKKVLGKFKRGEMIQVKFKGKVIAIGLSEFSSQEMERIKGVKSTDLAQYLENPPAKVAIHKDNLLLKKEIS